MNCKLFWRKAAAALLLAALVLNAGCKDPAATATATATATDPPARPQVTPAPDKVAPPAVSRFQDYSVRLKPARGPIMILKEPIAAQLIMDAFSSERLQVQDAVGKFNNKLEVLDPEGRAQYSFTLTSDGQQLLKSQDGRVFHMPEYIYYLLEDHLWTYEGSLVETPLKWNPEKDTSTAQLELELPRLLKTGMLAAFGYAPAYFTSYKIYSINTSNRNTAKVYMLLTYAGYDIVGQSFTPSFLYTTPATLIFEKIGGAWRLTELKQAPVTKEKKDLYANIRTIFPYDDMEDVVEDMNRTTTQIDDMVKDIERQATEYLNAMGISGLTVES